MPFASAEFIKESALRAGFDLCGVAPLQNLPELAYSLN